MVARHAPRLAHRRPPPRDHRPAPRRPGTAQAPRARRDPRHRARDPLPAARSHARRRPQPPARRLQPARPVRPRAARAARIRGARAVRVLGARGVAVLTEDLPLHRWRCDVAAPAASRSGGTSTRSSAATSSTACAATGPLPAREIEDRAEQPWLSTGWSNERNVSRMLDFMWVRGHVGIAARDGGQRLWDLMERCLPPDAPNEVLDDTEVTRRSALLALKALGVARMPHIRAHFTRGRYPGLPEVLAALHAAARSSPSRSTACRAMVGARRRRRRADATASSPAPRCCRRSTTCCATAGAPRSCSASRTGSRSTRRRSSASGGTSCCRSCTATG